ncbi:hypothetical protein DPEC_G00192410 [Dallia pectoralis]|uniref:Uncharacterized protein n=1 Tax=Dallia pectoralis TaxID=75939 RepID=A0ACC2GCN7_DALPE|nr:hypothetical protein DPEC_G00192410 [Dallia pectoralis]
MIKRCTELPENFPVTEDMVKAFLSGKTLQEEMQVFLGHYPEQHFSEKLPLQKMKDFKKELKDLSAEIHLRNVELELPYTYLDPEKIEASVAL